MSIWMKHCPIMAGRRCWANKGYIIDISDSEEENGMETQREVRKQEVMESVSCVSVEIVPSRIG